MYKRIVLIIFCCLFFISFSGCACKHEWIPATCTEPATCTKCGETEGEPLGHDWILATCKEAQTCSRCGQTVGELLGHDWIPATCEEPQTCSRCGLSTGEPLRHDWVEATNNEPKTCNRCDKTDGERLPYTWNVPVTEAGVTRGFYTDGEFYWFELSSSEYNTGSILNLLIYDAYYGFDMMVKQMDIVSSGGEHSKKNGIDYYIMSGYGREWIFYADMSGDDNGKIGLKVNLEEEMDACFGGEVID